LKNCAKIFIDNPAFNINRGMELDGLSISPFYITIVKSIDYFEDISTNQNSVTLVDLLLSRPDLNVNFGKKEKRKIVNVGFFFNFV
jgi:hypothetical protein